MKRPLLLLGLSALSGVLLFVSDFPVHAWPLQAVALLPFLFALERLCSSRWAALLAGITLGLANTLPLLRELEFPLFMGLPLAIYLSLLWMLIGLGIYLVRGWPTPLGPLAAGAIAALVEWVDFTLVPVWGTAQCFARVWSAAPPVAQIVSVAGVTGLVFLLVSLQSVLGRLIWGGAGRRVVSGLTLVVLLGAATGWCAWAWNRPDRGELGVAAIGWTADNLVLRGVAPQPRPGHLPVAVPSLLFERFYQPMVEEAARQEAEIVVSPEVGFWLEPAEEDEIISRATALATRTRTALVLGYFSRRRNSNHALIVDGRGTCRSEYTKSHLIPFVENYRKGTGALVSCQFEGQGKLRPRVGVMICQDDNFTDLARGYGRAAVDVVAVPTNDWLQVKEFHLENSIFRAIENDYAVVRAASNGVSVIVSPRGEVLARRDHFRDGPGLVLARVPLRSGPTLYSKLGDWPPLAGLLLLVAGWLSRRRALRVGA